MRHLATTEPQRDLGLVAVFQEALQVAQLDVVVAIIRTGPELDFLDLDDLLLQLGLVGALGFLVLELPVIHDPGDGRSRVGGDLHQVQVLVLSQPQSVHELDDAELLVINPYQAQFRRADLTVDTVTFVCSDVPLPQEDKKTSRAHHPQALLATSCWRRSTNAETGITPRSTLPRARTAT
ncbi:hypothetical protein D3C72_1321850 [compost metagenome]